MMMLKINIGDKFNRIYFVIEDDYKPVEIKAVFNDIEKAKEFIKNERNYRIEKIMEDIYIVIKYERMLSCIKGIFNNLEEAQYLSKKKSNYHVEIYSVLPLSEEEKKYWEKEKKHWDDLKNRNLNKI